jgi:hypothetical protein
MRRRPHAQIFTLFGGRWRARPPDTLTIRARLWWSVEISGGLKRMFKHRCVIVLCAGAIVLAGLATGARASSVTVTGRTYTNFVYYSGGRAIESADGHDGSGTGMVPDTLQGLTPTDVAISGSAHHEGTAYEWAYTAIWNVQQGYTASGNTLHAYGSTYLEIQPVFATTGISGWNTQEIQFVVSGTTAYDVAGHVSAAYYGTDQDSTRQNFALQEWNSVASIWVSLYFNYTDDDFTHSGSLDDGLYRILNFAYSMTADTTPFVQDSSWDWTLTFADAQVSAAVSATPLPAAVWLMGTGLFGLIGLTRRRRARKFYAPENFDRELAT